MPNGKHMGFKINVHLCQLKIFLYLKVHFNFNYMYIIFLFLLSGLIVYVYLSLIQGGTLNDKEMCFRMSANLSDLKIFI